MNNVDLFCYITKELYSHGGDGSVLVLFKQQDPNVVADEFEKWILADHNTTLKRTGLDKCSFSDMSNETIRFGAVRFDDGARFDPRRRDEPISVGWAEWDTFIITW